MIMNMSSEVGHMFVDDTYLPPDVTQSDILNYFTDIIAEYEKVKELTNLITNGIPEKELIAKTAIFAAAAIVREFGKSPSIPAIMAALQLALKELETAIDIIIYTYDQDAKDKFLTKMKFAMTIPEMRAAFMGCVIAASKEIGRTITNEDLKNKFIDWYNSTKADPKLVDNFTRLYDELNSVSAQCSIM